MNFKKLQWFLQDVWGLNRTICSADNIKFFKILKRYSSLNYQIISFKSGTTKNTWIAPPEWNLKEAFLKDKNNKIIASSKDSSLFVAPFSKNTNETISVKSLKKKLLTDKNNPKSFCYNWRFAYDFSLRGIS